MKKNLLNLDLQLFAEGEEGVEESVVTADADEQITDETSADSEGEAEESTTEEEPEGKDFKNEQNAAYANIRRKAEADAQAKMDSEIAKLCAGYVHPVTNRPITTLAEYKDALYQQDRLAAEAKLKDSGVDPSIIDDIVANNPVIQQAKAVIEESQMASAEQKLMSDFEVVKTLDPTIKTMQDIPNMDVIVSLLTGNPNMNLVDAYKVANFDALMNNARAGAKQGAINQIKGKSHMTGVDTLSEDSSDVEIPNAEYASLKETFPNKSAAELKKLYNATIRKLGGN